MKCVVVISAVLLSFFGQLTATAQNSLDSSIENHLNVFYEYEYSDVVTARAHLDSAILLSSETRNNQVLGRLNMYKGWYFQDIGEFDSSRICFFEALDCYTLTGSYQDIADVYGNIGNAYLDIGDLKNSLDYQFKSMNLNEIILANSLDSDSNEKAEKGRAYAWSNIASIYTVLHEYDKSLEYQLKGLNYEVEKNDSLGMAISYLGLATDYRHLNKLDSSIWYGEQAYRIFKQHNYTNGLLNAALGLFNNYYKRGRDRYDLLFEAYDLAIESEDKYSEVVVLKSLIGSNYPFSQDSLRRMISTANQIIDEYDYKNILGDYYRVEANYYARIGDFRNAFFSQLEFIDFFSRQKSQQQQVDYKSAELKQVFIQKSMQDSLNYSQTLHLQRIEQEKVLAKQDRIVTISIFGSLILILILVFLFRAFKLKQRTNQELNYKNILIENQRDIVEEKNREITDSINYAERLQVAILPPLETLRAELSMFIYYRPKDVVSGDFYWYEKKGDNIYIAAADCTGHGVPGAMVSVVCSNSLDRSVNEFHLTGTADILNKTRELVIHTFSKSADDVKDGMDISLCRINFKTGKITYSGAYNPLWLARRNEFITKEQYEKFTVSKGDEISMLELKADKQPIGLYSHAEPFTETTIQIEKGDTAYLFTDGFADQFGGENGKKLKYKPFKQILLSINHKTINDQQAYLAEFMEDWKKDYDQLDDICVLGIRL